MKGLCFILAGVSLLLAGCGAGEDPYKDAAPSTAAGPGADKMKEWAAKNGDNGKPGNEATPGGK